MCFSRSCGTKQTPLRRPRTATAAICRFFLFHDPRESSSLSRRSQWWLLNDFTQMFQHALKVMRYLIIAKSNDANPMRRYPCIPLFVISTSARRIVRVSINLYCELNFWAIKVNDVPADTLLATKLEVQESALSKMTP